MTPEILLQIACVMDLKSPFDMVYWCLFIFAFFLFARKSNLVPTSKKDLMYKHFLLRKDVEDHGSFLVVTMNWTKTIQKGERILRIPLVPLEKSIYVQFMPIEGCVGIFQQQMMLPYFLYQIRNYLHITVFKLS